MEAGGGGEGIPKKLGIHVGVEVDKTWRHCKPTGMDDPASAPIDPPNFDDLGSVDCHIPCKRRQAAAVVNPAIFDHHIVSHIRFPFFLSSIFFV
jgi:hypothetical protein